MEWTYEATKKGYASLWAKATLKPASRNTVLSRARQIIASKARYQALEVHTGVPWWWIAVAHNLEGSGRWNTYLGNGQLITQRTTIEPIGRGPFKSFEAGALDAIKLKKLDQIKVWDIPRALYLWEQFNGFGYVSKGINSPYVWSMTNLYTKGKYVRDHVYDANAVSDQIGAASMLLGLMELGAVSFEKEDAMAELQASIIPFEAIVPVLVRVIAGPAASLAIRALAEALGDDDQPATPAQIQQKLEAKPLKELVPALRRAEELVTELTTPVLNEAPVRAVDPVPVDVMKTQVAQPSQTPSTTTGPVVVQPVSPEPTFWDRFIPAGWKTTLGIVVYVGGHVAGLLGYVDPASAEAIATVGGGLAGVGVIAKIERWLPLFAGFLRVKKTVVQ